MGKQSTLVPILHRAVLSLMYFEVNFWMAHLSNPQMKFGNITIILLPTVRHDKGLTVGMLCGLLTKYTFNVWLCLSQWKTIIEQPLPNLWANRKPNVCLKTFQLGWRKKSRNMIIYTSKNMNAFNSEFNEENSLKLKKFLRSYQRRRGDRTEEILPASLISNSQNYVLC